MASKQSALDMNRQYPTSPVEDYVPSSPQYIPDPDMPVEPWHVKSQVSSSSKEDQSSYEHSGAPPAPPAPSALLAPPPAPPASPMPPLLFEDDQDLPPEKLPEPDSNEQNLPSNHLEEGECVDTSEEEEEEEAPADPWNDTAFDLEAKLLNLDEECYPKEDSRRGLVQEISQMHRCIDDT